jgi:ATP-binding cassette subfamily F protein uup
MNLLSIESLTKSFGEKLLFENISFGIESGQKIALIAQNGAGKSSLIKIIAGEDVGDSGRVTLGNEVKVSYLPQNPEMLEEQQVIDYLFDTDNELVQLIRDYEALTLSDSADKTQLDRVVIRMDELHAWGFESKIKEILGRFGIVNLRQKIEELSGGMRKKIALAKALIEEANLIILDEPTNHLDVVMIEWLENYLSRQNLSIFVVTHDRYFLDNVCNEIIELDNQKIYRYRGNYSYFLEKKAERIANEKSELERAKSLYQKELEWMRRQPQARATKAKAREDAFYQIEEKVKNVSNEKTRGFGLDMQRLGGKILELNYINKAYGSQVILNNFTYIFNKGDRIGVVGKNGSGKSTLLKIIMGEAKADAGKIVKGKTVEFGYFQQDGMPIKEDKRIIDIIKEIAEEVEMKKGSLSPAQFLSYFNFHTNIHYNYFSSLSGGEKRKLYLLTVLLKKPNFLILDEPTNDLDIATLNKLEEFLQNYNGCLMIVSHDRYFMDHMVDHIFAFEGDGVVRDYWGNYSEYHRLKKLEEKTKSPKSDAEKLLKSKPKQTYNKPTYKQVKEYEALEKEIEQLEAEKSELMDKLNSGQGTPDELISWSEQIGKLIEVIEEKSDRWLELSEIVDMGIG